MRPPAPTLVVDAAILVAATLGRRSAALEAVARSRHLLVTERGLAEAQRRIEFGLKRPDLLRLLDSIAGEFTVVPEREFEHRATPAGQALRDAAPSRNGSARDAHILACAWVSHSDIWSFDRDFAGTGIASWSTANLMRALADEATG